MALDLLIIYFIRCTRDYIPSNAVSFADLGPLQLLPLEVVTQGGNSNLDCAPCTAVVVAMSDRGVEGEGGP